jgi:hypothetical protein
MLMRCGFLATAVLLAAYPAGALPYTEIPFYNYTEIEIGSINNNDTLATAEFIASSSFSLEYVAWIEGISGSPSSTDNPHVSVLGLMPGDDVDDYFSFAVTAGETIVLDTDYIWGDGCCGDSELHLYDPSGNKDAYSDNALDGPGDHPSDSESFISFLADETGTWTARVEAWEGDEDALDSYTLHISLIPIPEPSTFALCGLGLVGMGIAGRRRRKTAA